MASHGGATDLQIDDAGGVAFHLTLPVHTHGELGGAGGKARTRPHKHGGRARYAESGTQLLSTSGTPQMLATSYTGSDFSGDTTTGWSPSGLERTSVSALGSDLRGVSGVAEPQPGCVLTSWLETRMLTCQRAPRTRRVPCRASLFSTVTDECPGVVCAASDEAVLRVMEEASASGGNTIELVQSAADLLALLARWPQARCVLILLWGLAGAPQPTRTRPSHASLLPGLPPRPRRVQTRRPAPWRCWSR